jgi:hypothetical protein
VRPYLGDDELAAAAWALIGLVGLALGALLL